MLFEDIYPHKLNEDPTLSSASVIPTSQVRRTTVSVLQEVL